ncbi:MAG: hypothetical protein LC749_12175 [Actinobacteria bacterium]|nr:hypothetical protein [Actinomycetota bacterium]
MADRLHITNNTGKTILQCPFAGIDASMIVGELAGTQGHNFGEVLVTDGVMFAFAVSGRDASVTVGREGLGGSISVRDSKDKPTLELGGEGADLMLHGNDNGSDIVLTNKNDKWRVWLRGESGGVTCLDEDGKANAYLGESGAYSELALGGDGRLPGRIILRSGHYQDAVILDAATGDIQLIGADCAEEFPTAEGETIEPGTLVVMDEHERIHPCSSPYDRRVVGIVSGACGTTPGIILGKNAAGQSQPVALAGKAYCKVDTVNGPVAIGDFLTTSSTPGHAMRAQDRERACGSIVGKALGALAQGTGMVPTLVTLA